MKPLYIIELEDVLADTVNRPLNARKIPDEIRTQGSSNAIAAAVAEAYNESADKDSPVPEMVKLLQQLAQADNDIIIFSYNTANNAERITDWLQVNCIHCDNDKVKLECGHTAPSEFIKSLSEDDKSRLSVIVCTEANDLKWLKAKQEESLNLVIAKVSIHR